MFRKHINGCVTGKVSQVVLTLMLMFFAVAGFTQKKATGVKVTKSAVADLKTIEEYNRSHPRNPNEKRIEGFRRDWQEGLPDAGKKNRHEENEEDEGPKPYRVPANAKVTTDPFGKMQQLNRSEEPQPNTPTPVVDFNGLDDNTFVIPPDVGGQVGPSHVITTLNSDVRISDRAGNVISTVTLDNFYSPLGAISTFDPKVLYDSYNGRWIVVACANATLATSAVIIAVSQTSNPTGSWSFYSIDVDATDVNWFDYPSIGINKDWLVVTGNMFTNSANSFVTGRMYVYNKADLYAGVASPGVTTINSGSNGFTICPAITYDNTTSTEYLVQNFNGNSGGNGYIGFYTLTGAVGSEVLSNVTLVSTPNPWRGSSNTTGNNFAPQFGSTVKLATNDSRMQKVVYRNGKLWAVHTVFLPAAVPTRSAIQWWQFNTDATIAQRGRIDDASAVNFYAFPSIDVNKYDDALIGCAKFNATIYASACYALRMATDPVNTFQTDYIYKAGLGYYQKQGNGSYRWGDYTSVTVDPNDETNFWTVQEYAAARANNNASSRWGTWWAGVAPPCTAPSTPGSISGPGTVAAGATGQVYSITAIAGATHYTWTFPAGCVITTGNNTNSVTVTMGNTAGTISVVANNRSCTSQAQTKQLSILSVLASSNSPVCPASTLQLFANGNGGTTPYTYSWTGPNSFSSAAANPTIDSVSAIHAGTYTVSVTDNSVPPVAVNSSVNVALVTVTGTATKTDATSYGSSTGSITATASGGTAPYEYKNGYTALTYQTSNQFDNLPAGVYRIYLRDANGCKGYTNVVTISEPAPVFTTQINKTDVTCFGASNGTITATVSGGIAPYQYKNGSLGTFQSSNMFGGLAPGTYRIYFKDAKSKTGYTDAVTIKQPASALTATFSKVDATCPTSANGAFVITAKGGTSPYQYVDSITGSSYPSNTVSNLAPATYLVNVKDGAGCVVPLAIVVGPSAFVSSLSKTDVTVYGGSDGTMTARLTGGTAPYQFKNGSNGVFLGDTVFGNLSVGTYRVYFKDSKSCTGYTNTVTITQPNPVFNAVAVKTDPTCKGSASGTVTAHVTGGISPYQYKNGSAGNVYTTDSLFGNLAAGTYRIYFKDAKGFTGYTNAVTLINPSNACEPVTPRSAKVVAKDVQPKHFEVVLSPNPSSTSFKILAHGKGDLPVYVRVLDAAGRVVFNTKGSIEQSINFGQSFRAGSYIVEVRQGEEVRTVKAVKAK